MMAPSLSLSGPVGTHVSMHLRLLMPYSVWKILVPQCSCGIDWNRHLNHQHPSNSTKNGVVQLALRILSSLELLPETKDSSNNYIKKFFIVSSLKLEG